jgi:hypothetical protein
MAETQIFYINNLTNKVIVSRTSGQATLRNYVTNVDLKQSKYTPTLSSPDHLRFM